MLSNAAKADQGQHQSTVNSLGKCNLELNRNMNHVKQKLKWN